jgi:hypothetical protein
MADGSDAPQCGAGNSLGSSLPCWSLPPGERREQDERHRDHGQDADDVEDHLNDWSSHLYAYSLLLDAYSRLHRYIFALMSSFAFSDPNEFGNRRCLEFHSLSSVAASLFVSLAKVIFGSTNAS